MPKRRQLFVIGAFIAPTLFCLLLNYVVGFYPPGPLFTLAVSTLFTRPSTWQSLGTPDHPIVSLDGAFDSVYVSTTDRRVFKQDLPRSGPATGWREIATTPRFEQPPLLAYASPCLLAADGDQLYAYDGRWRQIQHPLRGPIRGLVISVDEANMVFLIGDTTIVNSAGCNGPWEEIWNGKPLESNLALSNSRALVAADGKLWASPVSYRSSEGKIEWGKWEDVTGSLHGDSIRFISAGANAWIVAATESHVYRTWSSAPNDHWTLFEQGLPDGMRVLGMAGDRVVVGAMPGEIALMTDHGTYTLAEASGGTGDPDPKWQELKGLGDVTAFVNWHRTYAEMAEVRTFVASDRGIWTQSTASSGLGEFVQAQCLLLGVAFSLFGLSIVCGAVFGRWVESWLLTRWPL